MSTQHASQVDDINEVDEALPSRAARLNRFAARLASAADVIGSIVVNPDDGKLVGVLRRYEAEIREAIEAGIPARRVAIELHRLCGEFSRDAIARAIGQLLSGAGSKRGPKPRRSRARRGAPPAQPAAQLQQTSTPPPAPKPEPATAPNTGASATISRIDEEL